jgi:hypothetical protein
MVAMRDEVPVYRGRTHGKTGLWHKLGVTAAFLRVQDSLIGGFMADPAPQSPAQSSTNWIVILLLVVVVAIVAWFVFMRGGDDDTDINVNIEAPAGGDDKGGSGKR